MVLRGYLLRNATGSQGVQTISRYRVRDCLHEERSTVVSVDRIGSVVSAWLSELGAASPLAERLTQSVRDADWPKVHALSESLAVEVSIAD